MFAVSAKMVVGTKKTTDKERNTEKKIKDERRRKNPICWFELGSK